MSEITTRAAAGSVTELVRVPEACTLLRITEPRFRTLRAAGRIPGLVRLPNGGVRVRRGALEAIGAGVAA